ncbi:MAG: SPOR domain-containing protein [Zetaproteobacteria bacterium]|nr:SPOR domain-containing protein [Zetaproteobacteria bacterium]
MADIDPQLNQGTLDTNETTDLNNLNQALDDLDLKSEFDDFEDFDLSDLDHDPFADEPGAMPDGDPLLIESAPPAQAQKDETSAPFSNDPFAQAMAETSTTNIEPALFDDGQEATKANQMMVSTDEEPALFDDFDSSFADPFESSDTSTSPLLDKEKPTLFDEPGRNSHDIELSSPSNSQLDFDLSDLQVLEQASNSTAQANLDEPMGLLDDFALLNTPAAAQSKPHAPSASKGLLDDMDDFTPSSPKNHVPSAHKEKLNMNAEHTSTGKNKTNSVTSYLPWVATIIAVVGMAIGGFGAWMVTQDRNDIAALDDMIYDIQNNLNKPDAHKDASITEMKDQIIYLEKQLNEIKEDNRTINTTSSNQNRGQQAATMPINTTPIAPEANGNMASPLSQAATPPIIAVADEPFKPIEKPAEKEPELQLNLLQFDHNTAAKQPESMENTQIATTQPASVSPPRAVTNTTPKLNGQPIYIINIASFIAESRALMEQKRLHDLGVDTTISTHLAKGKTWYRLQYKKTFTDQAYAKETMDQIRLAPGVESMWLEKRS